MSITRSANSTFIEVIKQLLKLYNFLTNGMNCLPSRPSCRLCSRRFPGADLEKHCQMFTLSKTKKNSGCIRFPLFCQIYLKRARLLSLSKVNGNHHFCLEIVPINKAFSSISMTSATILADNLTFLLEERWIAVTWTPYL